jgi:hypothetical protein
MKHKCVKCGGSNIGWDAWADETGQTIVKFDHCECLDCGSTDVEKVTSRSDNILLEIAKKNLGFETLDARGSDSLDFKESAVWSIKKALEEAFDAGYKMCRQARG